MLTKKQWFLFQNLFILVVLIIQLYNLIKYYIYWWNLNTKRELFLWKLNCMLKLNKGKFFKNGVELQSEGTIVKDWKKMVKI